MSRHWNQPRGPALLRIRRGVSVWLGGGRLLWMIGLLVIPRVAGSAHFERGEVAVLIDARNVESGRSFECDVCIIGGGAAGITLARELGSRQRSVCLLEAGGFERSPRQQALYGAQASGTLLGPQNHYLLTSRIRAFGGTTGHWLGWCRPLARMDFERRPWVADSGWPIDEGALSPYYPRAAEILEIESFDDEHDASRPELLPLRENRIVSQFYHFSPPTRFGERYRAELVESPAVRVFLHANVVNLTADPNVDRVMRVDVATLEGASFSVGARVFVLAAGGVENARLLLASDSQRPHGLGNDQDLVGRYFMDHPHVNHVGHVVLSDAAQDHSVYDVVGRRLRRRTEVALLFPSEETQRREELLNVAVQMIGIGSTPSSADDTLKGRAIHALDGIARPGVERSTPLHARVDIRCEQSPSRESRVTLTPDRDELGVRRVRLNWQLGSREAHTMRRMLRIVAAELGRAAQGRLQLVLNEERPWKGGYGGNHHMGTTRMSDSPTRGVVDADCRVFGVSNLFVAGSSVFPTVGVANPTFSIVALCLRLADRLVIETADG